VRLAVYNKHLPGLAPNEDKTMKNTLISIGLIIFFLFSCNEDSDWIILCGELNDNLAFNESDGNFYYDNIEYFFINKKSKKCYRNLDSSNFGLAKSLLNAKLLQLGKADIDENVFRQATITKQTKEYVNIEFVDSKGRQILYKVSLLDTESDNVFVYTKYDGKYIETMWTDRSNKTRKTKKLIALQPK